MVRCSPFFGIDALLMCEELLAETSGPGCLRVMDVDARAGRFKTGVTAALRFLTLLGGCVCFACLLSHSASSRLRTSMP